MVEEIKRLARAVADAEMRVAKWEHARDYRVDAMAAVLIAKAIANMARRDFHEVLDAAPRADIEAACKQLLGEKV